MAEDGAAGSAEHWDRVYAAGDTGRSWYQPHAETSMELISRHVPDLGASVVDAGGGASTLVDDLLAAGRGPVTVLDLSRTAMRLARQRLGDRGAAVEWAAADVRSWRPAQRFGVWHDRAVLHFLTEPGDRSDYRATLLAATRVGSVVILGVFGPQGPQQCSGLPVRRHDEADLMGFLTDRFAPLETLRREHVTPAGVPQQFVWVAARRSS